MPPSTNQPPPVPTPPPFSKLRRKDTDRDMLEPGEVVVAVIHRHPIGIVAIYLVALLAIFAVLAIGIFVAPDIISDFSPQAKGLITAGGIFAFAVLLIVLFVLTYVYRQSKIIVTDKSLIQALQKGLFIRKVSRLSMANVEDVAAEQRGIFPHLFNYGTLMIQTAGERENFTFPYAPDPNLYADQILEAREQFIHGRHDLAQINEQQSGPPPLH